MANNTKKRRPLWTRKTAEKAVGPRRTCTIEDRKGDGAYADVLRFCYDLEDEHGTRANAICIAVRQSENFRAWKEQQCQQ